MGDKIRVGKKGRDITCLTSFVVPFGQKFSVLFVSFKDFMLLLLVHVYYVITYELLHN